MIYDRPRLRSELTRDEALRLKVYHCTAGKLTIGVGRNLDDVGIRPHEAKALGITKAGAIARGITREQAMFLLDSDIDTVEAQLDHDLPWWRKLDGVRQRVLLNMTFNLGIKGMLGFRNTLGMIQRGDYVAASRGMKSSRWHMQVGDRAVRLEAMMATGMDA
jgi:lysozyme